MNTLDNSLWSSSFVKICLVNLFIFISFHALLPTFPFYVSCLGGGATAIGIATALFSLASIASRPFAGWLVDTRGRKVMLLVGLVGLTLVPLGYFAVVSILFAIILRAVHGVFHASASNASTTWVTDIVPRSRMGEGLGFFGLSMAISTAVAPALGLWVMRAYGFIPLFGVASCVALVAILIVASIRKKHGVLAKTPLHWSHLFERLSIPAAVTQFFFMMTFGVVEVYVALYAENYGLPSGGVYFICMAVATIGARIALGSVIDRHGEAPLVFGGNAAALVGVLALVFIHNWAGYVLSAVLIGVAFGAVQPSLQAMAVCAVDSKRRGAANSTFFVSFDLGIAVGGFAAGILAEKFGYDAMFLGIAAGCVCSSLYYLCLGRKHVSSLSYRRHISHSGV